MRLEWQDDPVIDHLIDEVGPFMRDSESWVRFALACLDQAGISASGQVRIHRAIEKERPEPIGDEAP